MHYDITQESTFIQALDSENITLVEKKLKEDPKLSNIRTKTGAHLTPLLIAGLKGNLQLVNILLSFDARIHELTTVDENSKWGILDFAAAKGHFKFIIDFLKKDYKRVKKNELERLIKITTIHGHAECLIHMLQYIKPETHDHFDPTPLLHLAAQYGHAQCIIQLINTFQLDLRAVNKDGDSILNIAAYHGKTECIVHLKQAFKKLKLEQKAKNGKTPFHQAASNGQTNCIFSLQKKYKIDINILNRQNQTLLHSTVGRSQSFPKCAIALIKKFNIHLDQKDKNGYTFLGLAAKYGQFKYIDKLYKQHKPIKDLILKMGIKSFIVPYMYELHTNKRPFKYLSTLLKDLPISISEINEVVHSSRRRISASFRDVYLNHIKSALSNPDSLSTGILEHFRWKVSLTPNGPTILDNFLNHSNIHGSTEMFRHLYTKEELEQASSNFDESCLNHLKIESKQALAVFYLSLAHCYPNLGAAQLFANHKHSVPLDILKEILSDPRNQYFHHDLELILNALINNDIIASCENPGFTDFIRPSLDQPVSDDNKEWSEKLIFKIAFQLNNLPLMNHYAKSLSGKHVGYTSSLYPRHQDKHHTITQIAFQAFKELKELRNCLKIEIKKNQKLLDTKNKKINQKNTEILQLKQHILCLKNSHHQKEKPLPPSNKTNQSRCV